MKKITVKDFREMKGSGHVISMLTAYDASMARLLDQAGVDSLLVGDSLGMVMLGYDSTVPVTMEEMLHHARAVSRGTEHALLIGDMPFGSYQVSVEQTILNGTRFLKEAGCDCVKLEGGQDACIAVKGLTQAGVPVMGHLGLTPQTAGQLGGFKVQGNDMEAARQLLADALALEEAGAFAIVLEAVPSPLTKILSQKVSIPIIGIGAGPDCDGQVLVTHDMLGLFEKFTPKFVKQYCNLAPDIKHGVQAYLQEIQAKDFPSEEHSFAVQQDFSDLLL